MRPNSDVVNVQRPTSAQFSMFSDPLGGPGFEQPAAPLTAPHTDVLPPAA